MASTETKDLVIRGLVVMWNLAPRQMPDNTVIRGMFRNKAPAGEARIPPTDRNRAGVARELPYAVLRDDISSVTEGFTDITKFERHVITIRVHHETPELAAEAISVAQVLYECLPSVLTNSLPAGAAGLSVVDITLGDVFYQDIGRDEHYAEFGLTITTQRNRLA